MDSAPAKRDEWGRGGAPIAPLGSRSDERLLSLDFIRGIAVLGILAANIVGYALASIEQSWPSVFGPVDTGSTAVWVIELIFISGKMRALFAILFGAGLALFIDRVEDRGGIGVVLQVRRLGWLLLFGIAHFYVLYRGDILATYAFWGFFAMLLTRAKAGLLLTLAAVLYLIVVPLDTARYGAALEQSNAPAVAAGGDSPFLPKAYDYEGLRSDAARDDAIMGSGSLPEIVRYKHEQHAYYALSGALDALYDSFPMMLAGIAFFRLGLFERGVGTARIRRWGWGLAVVGIASGGMLAWPVVQSDLGIETTAFYAHALVPLQRVPMTLGWLFLLLGYLPALARGVVGERIVAAGRMAFSNYIGTSLLMALLFQGWGLGLFGQFTRLELTGFVLLGWAAMLAWSKPWLAHFRQGPLEWLWRCLTYWRFYPIRRQP